MFREFAAFPETSLRLRHFPKNFL